MFRLHIDIPLDVPEADAAAISQSVMDEMAALLKAKMDLAKVKKVQYRLGNDEDRCVKNYLIKDENNHIANRKSVIEL